MKFKIKHEIQGRLRIHLALKRMTYEEADTLQYYLMQQPGVKRAAVYERTADAAIEFSCDRFSVLKAVQIFRFENASVPKEVLQNSGRALNAQYREKLITKVVVRYLRKLFIPAPIRHAFIVLRAIKYIIKGIRSLAGRRLDVSVLDAIAIGASVIRGDFETAGTVMFLLGIGDIMEEWTHKKSVNDLAESMALGVRKVWLKTGESETLVASDEVRPGDKVIVHMGNVIPFDGIVTAGEGLVNQSTLTGEPLSVRKTVDGYVYAGTALEEGELTILVKETNGSSRYEKIISVIEETEKLKSEMESRTEHLADRLVPYTLGGTILTWLITRNVTRTMAVLMVDFSCALKLAMPITVLSAIREAGEHQIMIKGGKFIEKLAEADTIVFDKTGTLTEATPVVMDIVPMCGMPQDELLRIAACLEEHFPHSVAKAVVSAAQQKHLEHEEMHTRIEYIVAHGIASYIDGKRVVIGSGHFVFEDEKCVVDGRRKKRLEGISEHYSKLYLAIDGRLAAVICIEDPVRKEAAEAVTRLREAGFKKIVMMTGDSRSTAAAVAAKLQLDEFHAEVLPEQKAGYIKAERAKGGKVVMVGDGINDSPALSAADAGIAISDGAEIAREIADITIAADDLNSLVTLKKLSTAMTRRVNRNFAAIIGINGALIALGVAGIIPPATSALIHNLSTIGISVKSMSALL